ncbi:hypothetical protein CYY_009637 [Polysphondylium violaceum]|uniref:Reverse transcriptase domain-containing protein n=1 Tax=Polysphondylium violaceum TaxID=133409 RepID=A0A8J4V2R8_9MYCE|nr:hypothetical protein CYY_009637 [Polysphondylium violaceum]
MIFCLAKYINSRNSSRDQLFKFNLLHSSECGRIIKFTANTQNQQPIHITAVYAPATQSIRKIWLQDVLKIADLKTDILIGDINIRQKSLRPEHFSENTLLSLDIQSSGLSELEVEESSPIKHTFTLTQTNEKYILDRVFISDSLLNKSPSLTYLNVNKQTSDHNILHLTIPTITQASPKSKLWKLNHRILTPQNIAEVTTIIDHASQLIVNGRNPQKKDAAINEIIHPTTKQKVSTQPEIEDAFTTFYSQLFAKKADNADDHQTLLEKWTPNYPPSMNTTLSAPISDQEIILAITKMKEGKAPGEDGFVPGRLLHDNIISLSDTIDTANTMIITNKDQTLLPVITFYDAAKAFDSVSHNAIERSLNRVNLPIQIINTIMDMIKGSTIKIQVNGNLTKPFPVETGIKQGDPISPTLFVIVVESLASAKNSDQEIKGIPLSLNNSNLKNFLKILQFAHDTCSLAYNMYDQKRIQAWLDLFINTNKCSVILLEDPNKYPAYIPYPTVQRTAHERYLGFHICHQAISPQVPTKIKSIKNDLIKWKMVSHSLRGKVTIMKTYVLSQLTFHLYLEETSPSPLESLNKLITWYLYSKDTNTISKPRSKIRFDRAHQDIQYLPTDLIL